MMEEYIKAIIERIKPDTTHYVKQPCRGRVVAVHPDVYTCDVQPLDENHPVIPNIEILSLWATPTTRIVALPTEDSEVIIGFQNGDVTAPYIQGFIPEEGLTDHFLIESGNARIWIDEAGVITLESDKKLQINADQVLLGKSATEALIKGNTFQSLFNAHTHGTGVGPSTPPIQPLTGTEISEVNKCV